MINAVKYSWDAGPFYIYCKKHFCPKCGKRTGLHYITTVVNSNSGEAKDYDFSICDQYYKGNVKFKKLVFYCEDCNLDIPFHEMKEYEKEKKQ